jgi:hypothetical protein
MSAIATEASLNVVLASNTRARIRGLLLSTRARVCAYSALMIAPCFWHSRVQAGDFSSHLYNAWLADLIGQGAADRLVIVPQWTNVLFDLLLTVLMNVFGAWGAEHIALPLMVLIFVWGAFAVVSALSGRRPWYILTFLAMLAYGWVFHMGFMNFYLSLGLCFWAFALLWKPDLTSALCAALLVALASLAHALPVAWLAGTMAYVWVARKIRPRDRILLGFGCLALLVIVRHLLLVRFPARWSAEQAISMTGADQVWVFSSKYYPLEILLLLVWLSLFRQVARHHGEERLLLGIPFQLCVIISAAVLLIPGAILLPGYSHALRFISERMSLVVAVMFCALLGRASPGSHQKAAIAVMLGLFFSFLYVDTRALNYVEDLMEQSVAQIPPGSRVVSALCDQRRDVNLLAHTIDRVCIGRCFSYANYEASTAQFRIRAPYANPIVISEYRESGALQEGNYVVKPSDAPLYQIYLRRNYIATRVLKAGDVTGSTCFESTPSPRNLFREHSHAN